MRSKTWPFPGDQPVDRARQVAIQYRDALNALDPEACKVIDSAAELVGESWVVQESVQELPDAYVTVQRAAELTGRSPRWVYDYVQKNPHIVMRRAGPMKVSLAEIRSAVAHERARRTCKEP